MLGEGHAVPLRSPDVGGRRATLLAALAEQIRT